MQPTITSDVLLLASPFLLFFLLIPFLAFILGDSDDLMAIKNALGKLLGKSAE